MIFKPRWQQLLMQGGLSQLLANAHKDMTWNAATLRDGAKYDVWVENPSDRSKMDESKGNHSFEGWRVDWAQRFQFVNTALSDYGADIQAFEPATKTAMDGFVASLPNIAAVFNSIVANYEDGSGNLVQQKISQAHRDLLATAMEAELEPEP